MLQLKQAEVQQLITSEQARLTRIEARLQQIEQSALTSPYEVVLKHVEAQTVAAIREVLPTCSQIRHLHTELVAELCQQNVETTGLLQVLWYDAGYQLENVDAEVIVPISQPFFGNGRVKSYRLPEVIEMACVIHHG